MTGSRPRPRSVQQPDGVRSSSHTTAPRNGRRRTDRYKGPASALARIEPGSPAQVAGAAGNALVTVGRVGRLLTRSGIRLARQVPVVAIVEAQAQRVAVVAAAELDRLLQIPQQLTGSADEQRIVALVQNAHHDPEPLRTAMSELLDRSVVADDDRGREYLFGSLVRQLVPDEARMLAALATGRPFAVVDVLARQSGRSGKTRPVLTNVSTLGPAAGVAVPQNTPTYLTRLHALGLVEFASAGSSDALAAQFDSLRGDPEIRAARDEADQGKQTSAKVVRKTVRLSPLGREFWQACAPPAPGSRR